MSSHDVRACCVASVAAPLTIAVMVAALLPAPAAAQVRAPLFRIAGTVIDSRGAPAVRPTVVALRRESASRVVQNSASTDADGRFVITPLPAGEYRLGVLNLSGRPDAAHEFATATVRIDRADVTDLVIRTRPGVTLSGSVRYEPQAPDIGATITIAPADRFAATYSIQSSQTIRGAAFALTDVFGPMLVRASAPGRALAAVLLNGRDITDVPTEFAAADSGRLVIVLTADAPSVNGMVTDAAGAPARDAVVVLFGEDRRTWVPQSSMLRFGTSDADGRFRIDGLRVGRYFAVALPRDLVPSPIEPDARAFEALTGNAVMVALAAGERRRLTLRLDTR